MKLFSYLLILTFVTLSACKNNEAQLTPNNNARIPIDCYIYYYNGHRILKVGNGSGDWGFHDPTCPIDSFFNIQKDKRDGMLLNDLKKEFSAKADSQYQIYKSLHNQIEALKTDLKSDLNKINNKISNENSRPKTNN